MTIKPGYYMDHYGDIAIKHKNGDWELMCGGYNELTADFYEDEDVYFTAKHRNAQALQYEWEYIGPL